MSETSEIEKKDAVLVCWHPANHRRLGRGFLRTMDTTRESLFLAEEEIITTGIEHLKPGKSLVRCHISPSDDGFHVRRATDVEIYIRN
jgi:hypothetical protein